MRSTTKKQRKGPRQVQRELRYFWGGVMAVALFAILLMYVALS